MVVGGDSCLKGHVFKSQHHILGGHFSHFFVAKIKCLFEGTKINEKEVGDGPFKKYTINMISNTFAMQVCK